MPQRPDHPDHEQLAAFEAGDGDRRERTVVEAHLAGCPSCAEVVASVGLARSRLAVLEQPELPPGFHDRLAAALEAEDAQTVPARPASRPARRVAAERPPRPTPWYRRPVAWGAAAALVLAALVVPFLDQSGDLTTASGGAGGADLGQREAAPAGAGRLPVFSVPGEVSAAAVRARLVTDRQAKAALDSAAGSPGGEATAGVSPGAPPATQASGQDGDQAYRSTAPAPQAGTADLQSCLPGAAAAADPATRPLVPAFFVEGTYKGREATVL
ncbi:MAG TPA: zf-HC2 domain-containing protein, partial [Actinomycetes bacterium]|nr:zf-HC2 domain-containing protein [Actinomycetes bacterium]